MTTTTALTSFYAQYTRDNRGPLPTTFTPPPDCFQLVRDGNDETDAAFIYGRTCSLYSGTRTTLIENPSCFHFTPPPTPTTATTIAVTDHAAVYSPANACPEGFTTACELTRAAEITPELRDPTQWPLWRLLQYGETAYGCCPSGFACGLDPGSCVARTPLTTTTGTYLEYDSSCSAATATGPIVVQPTQPRFLLITSAPVSDISHSTSLPFGAEIGIAFGVSIATILLALGCCFLGKKSILVRPERATADSEGESTDTIDMSLMAREGPVSGPDRGPSPGGLSPVSPLSRRSVGV